MNRAIPPTLFELGLLLRDGSPLLEAYDTVSKAHADDAEITALYAELTDAFMHNQLAAATPLLEREHNDTICPIAGNLLQVTIVSGNITLTLYAALAYILRAKLKQQTPTPIDCLQAADILNTSGIPAGHGLEREFESWSSDPKWLEAIRTRLTTTISIAPDWLHEVPTSVPSTPLPIEERITEFHNLMGMTEEAMTEVYRMWNGFMYLYEKYVPR
jgi:hypothetical protein